MSYAEITELREKIIRTNQIIAKLKKSNSIEDKRDVLLLENKLDRLLYCYYKQFICHV